MTTVPVDEITVRITNREPYLIYIGEKIAVWQVLRMILGKDEGGVDPVKYIKDSLDLRETGMLDYEESISEEIQGYLNVLNDRDVKEFFEANCDRLDAFEPASILETLTVDAEAEKVYLILHSYLRHIATYIYHLQNKFGFELA